MKTFQGQIYGGADVVMRNLLIVLYHVYSQLSMVLSWSLFTASREILIGNSLCDFRSCFGSRHWLRLFPNTKSKNWLPSTGPCPCQTSCQLRLVDVHGSSTLCGIALVDTGSYPLAYEKSRPSSLPAQVAFCVKDVCDSPPKIPY